MGCGPDGYLVYLPAPDEPEEDRASVSHTIAPIPLEPGEERFRCHAWTLDNERPVYVNAVHFLNAGSIHHSNWYVVPDTVYDGPDGTFDCGERDFDGLAAAQAGTVLFAQSTQAWEESLAFGDGTVIRIPERSRIVGELHVLNLAPAARDTDARITLELLHPYHVETVLNPMLLSYLPIEVPGGTEVVHRTTCFVGEDLVIHHVLPHFHGTTNLFDLRMDDSADSLLRIEGFGASPLGKAFDPPLEVPESSKLTMSCRIRNPYAETIEWGIGIDEMCLAFAMVDSRSLNVGVADTLADLAVVAGRQGRGDEALDLGRRALEIYERGVGPDHPNVATILNNLGLQLAPRGEVDDALAHYDRALRIREAALGPDHENVAETLMNRGYSRLLSDDHAGARRDLERSIAIVEARKGKDSPDLLTALTNLGLVANAEGKVDESVALHTRALELSVRARGEDHPSVGIARHNIGDLLAEDGRCAEALPHFERAMAIFEARLGEDHADIGYPATSAGRCLAKLGRPQEAVALLERALRLRTEGDVAPKLRKATADALAHARTLLAGVREPAPG